MLAAVVRPDDATGLGRHAGHVDNPPPAALRIPSSTACVSRKADFQVHRQHLVEDLLGDLLQRHQPGGPGVVDQHAHRPQPRLDLRANRATSVPTDTSAATTMARPFQGRHQPAVSRAASARGSR